MKNLVPLGYTLAFLGSCYFEKRYRKSKDSLLNQVLLGKLMKSRKEDRKFSSEREWCKAYIRIAFVSLYTLLSSIFSYFVFCETSVTQCFNIRFLAVFDLISILLETFFMNSLLFAGAIY
jgi:hypothetical protein